MTDPHALMQAVVRVYERHRNREKTIAALVKGGVSEAVATVAVDDYLGALRSQRRRKGFTGMLAGLGITLLFGLIFALTGRLYFVILIAAAVSFLFGLLQSIFGFGSLDSDQQD